MNQKDNTAQKGTTAGFIDEAPEIQVLSNQLKWVRPDQQFNGGKWWLFRSIFEVGVSVSL